MMNHTTVPVWLLAALVAGAATLRAQEPGLDVSAPDGAIAQDQAVQETAVEPETGKTATQLINDYAVSHDISPGYDEERQRIVVMRTIDFDVRNPRVSSDFIDVRSEEIGRLLLEAKGSIIETILSKMSGERILEIPGNPIAKQVAKEQQELNRQVEEARKALEELDADLAEKLKQRDGVTASEFLAIVSSWFTEKDRENLAETLDANKKQSYEEAKAAYRETQKRYEELAAKAEAAKGTIKAQLTTTLSRVSAMPIFGCTVLQQAESVQKKGTTYKYQIAILYSWSLDMQKAAGAILQGESVAFAPGKKSIRQWLNQKAERGALAEWCGPRHYIDNQGNMWFLGIACTAVEEDAEDNNQARDIADLTAAAEVMFSLFADASSSKTLNKQLQTRLTASGEAESRVYKDYSKTQREAFQNIQISGNAPLWSGVVKHPASGIDLNVAVYGVNSGSAKTLADIQKQSVALGIEVNTAQEVERGRQAEMRRQFEASKNNPAARAAGARQAKEELAAEAAKSRERRAARKGEGFKPSNAQDARKTSGSLRTGSSLIIDDDDE